MITYLASGVPNLKLYSFILHHNSFYFKIYSNSANKGGIKFSLAILKINLTIKKNVTVRQI